MGVRCILMLRGGVIEMSPSAKFICKCGKTENWIAVGETTKESCPKCGRVYKGVYNKKLNMIEAIEINKSNEIRKSKKQ
jgi:hypothetical protein